MGVRMLGVEEIFFEKMAVFEVDVTGGYAYMKSKPENYNNDHRYVIVVDAQKIVELWRLDPSEGHSSAAHGNCETWPQDRKYHHAMAGFSHGRGNPVPLAKVVCYEYENRTPVTIRRWGIFEKVIGFDTRKIDYVGFVDGITRTIWLLSNGAKSFPVECCDRASAERLHRLAGVGEFPICSVSELILTNSNFEK